MSAINRPTNPCKNPACGNTLFVAEYDRIDNKWQAVWQCTNCCWIQPRQQRNRLSNERRAFKLYLALRDAWKSTDEALDALIETGTPSGCLLVHGSFMNYHMRQLSASKKKLSNWEVKYHAAKAKEELERAQEFVKAKQEASCATPISANL